jgi:hypothetical protein
MIVPLPEIAIAALLAAGFAAVGELVLRRRSRSAYSWNESFLVGAGTCAAALFPLSLIWPCGALRATLAALCLATGLVIARRVFRKASPSDALPRGAGRALDRVAAGWAVALVLVVCAFAVLNFRYALRWDGFQVWATRAQQLHFQGALTRWWFPEEAYQSRFLTYPPLVPLYETLLCFVRGGFDFDVLKPVFLVFYVSMLLSTYAAARAVAGARLALAATLLLALLRPLSHAAVAGGFADMPQAAMVAGVVAAALRRHGSQRALPWLIGSLTTIKAEGTLLAGVAAAAVISCLVLEDARPFQRTLRSHWKAAAIVAAFFVGRVAYLRWLGINDTQFDPIDAGHVGKALERTGRVAFLCVKSLLNPFNWGLFWPAFLAAGLVLAWRGSSREKCLAAATAAGVVLFAAPFLFTNWELDAHIAQAHFRLLAQLAPAAAVTIAAGYRRGRGDAPVSPAR